jgi:hypothetical protein
VGRDTEWEKVKEIYKLGLKHGMKLAAISGVNGVFSDEAIAKVVTLAKKARLTWDSSNGAKTIKPAKPRTPAAAKKAPAKKAVAKAKPVAKKTVVAEVPAKKAVAKKTAVKKTVAARKAAKAA